MPAAGTGADCNPSGFGRRFWAVAPASAQNRTGETGTSGLSRKAEGYHVKAEALSPLQGAETPGASARPAGQWRRESERKAEETEPERRSPERRFCGSVSVCAGPGGACRTVRLRLGRERPQNRSGGMQFWQTRPATPAVAPASGGVAEESLGR